MENSLRKDRGNTLRFPLIGLSGKAGCGKDTLARLLTDQHHTVTYRLADPIKWALSEMFDFDSVDWESRDWKEKTIDWIGQSPRFLAQTLGTEWGRNIVGRETWIRLADKLFKEIDTDSGWTMVVPDIRFNDEAMWVYSRGGMVVQIDRPGLSSINSHSSEAGLSEAFVSGKIVNDSDPEAMLTQLLRIIDRQSRYKRHG